MRKRYNGEGRGAPEYNSWRKMIARCYDPDIRDWNNYGGRGITVCDEWREDYMAFLRDMARRPTPQHTIDRIDNDGPYCPRNCRWALRAQQMRNTRRTHMITALGRTQPLLDWANELGVTPMTIYGRIRRGWSLEAAVSTPADTRYDRRKPSLRRLPSTNTRNRFVTFNGETLTVAAWARRAGVSRETMRKRLSKWPLHEALQVAKVHNVGRRGRPTARE